ncbi:MAG: tagaturonate reductase [Clostridia bacterium]|nr:tagaturonate reductase [Clostridia bacterium]
MKVLQYGEGNFLRTFADAYFDALNKEAFGEYKVNIVKPIAVGSIEKFKEQNNKYHIVLRGVDGGEASERVYGIDCIQSVIDPYTDYDAYMALAADAELKLIVSNTTEAGICYNADDKMEGFADITYPAKLTKFLYARYRAGLSGVYILPVELIDNNADCLKECVDKYIALWGLDDGFKMWNDKENFYCNTLVDRIVSGYPRDTETLEHITALVGERDGLVAIGEPFGLWAIEKKGEIEKYVLDGIHNVEVVLTDDIGYYKKRKVRVLNGSHTNLVSAGLIHGAKTVYDCMTDERLHTFAEDTLREEIIPFVSDDIAATTAFADSVIERFLNPYLNHQLISISLNSISKWRARDLPSFKDYYSKHGRIAPSLTKGFAYLMALYSTLHKVGEEYYVTVCGEDVVFRDDREHLEFFANGGDVTDFMSKVDVWGESLLDYEGFGEAVAEYVKMIKEGKYLV